MASPRVLALAFASYEEEMALVLDGAMAPVMESASVLVSTYFSPSIATGRIKACSRLECNGWVEGLCRVKDFYNQLSRILWINFAVANLCQE
jgi:hypothetical protein